LQVRFSGEGVRSSRGQPARAGVRANSDRHGSPNQGMPPPRRAAWPSCSSAAASSPPLLGAAHPQSPHKPAPGSVARRAVAAQFAQLPPPSARRGVGIGQSYPLIPLTGAFVHHLQAPISTISEFGPPCKTRQTHHLTICIYLRTGARSLTLLLVYIQVFLCAPDACMLRYAHTRKAVRDGEMVSYSYFAAFGAF
jgi:hypothetical protein